MLRVRDLHAYYGRVHALKGVSLDVEEGEVVALLGNNGAGKTTLLKVVSGLLPPTSGTIEFMGQRIDGLAAERIVRLGVSMVPEGRRVFAQSSVRENLELGAYTRSDKAAVRLELADVMSRFPILHTRSSQLAGTLSGGEQQMLAIARGLMSRPRLMMLDEPSLGLMPTLVQEVFRMIRSIRDEHLTILLVEQNARKALGVADRAYVLETGEVLLQGSGEELQNNDRVRRAYLGGS